VSISVSITTRLASLQAQVDASQPLAEANHATLTAIKLNAATLVAELQSALDASSVLDTYVASTDPELIISGVLKVSEAADDQNTLSLMRGLVGRAAKNLELIPS
jgi:hypothetical protein